MFYVCGVSTMCLKIVWGQCVFCERTAKVKESKMEWIEIRCSYGKQAWVSVVKTTPLINHAEQCSLLSDEVVLVCDHQSIMQQG